MATTETTATPSRRIRRLGGGARFLGLRFLSYLAVAAISVILNFALPRLMPGDPADLMIQQIIAKTGLPPGPLELESIYARYGDPDESVASAFVGYIGSTLRGDLGLSTANYPVPVTELIVKALPWTFYLGLASTIIGWLIGTFFGAFLGWRPGSKLDSLLTPVSMFVNNIPAFWLGMIILWYFALNKGWFPKSGAYNTRLEIDLTNPVFLLSVIVYGILPLAALIIVGFTTWMFTMRNMMITTVNEDYVQLARAKGLGATTVRNRYAARNALLPNFTGLAQSIGGALTAVVLAEGVFIYPGVGGLLSAAQAGRDYPLMQGVMLMVIFMSLLFNFLADSVYTLLDPRIREH